MAEKFDLNRRSKEIDFLRGLAVVLVLFSHHWIFQGINNTGWVGVDLFFVLSGFLVSSLLFREYQKFGNVKPALFLIRRGFKIYPLFYLAILLTVILLFFFPDAYFFPESRKLYLNTKGIFAGFFIESFFLQSYLFGFWGHTWSLSVEEMFYFTLVALVFWMSSKKLLSNASLFYKFSLMVFTGVLMFRFLFNFLYPHHIINYTAFHLRCDSLFAGVTISYAYNFQYDRLENFYQRFKTLMRIFFLPLIFYIPFYNVLESPFILTIGFTMIYVAFSILLLHFLFEKNLLGAIDGFLGRWFTAVISKIGLYSYGIYLFHVFIARYLTGEDYARDQYFAGSYTYAQVVLSFLFYFFTSILVGIGMSKLVEQPMLKMRDKYFPRRSH